jgi:hypothetical protein
MRKSVISTPQKINKINEKRKENYINKKIVEYNLKQIKP